MLLTTHHIITLLLSCLVLTAFNSVFLSSAYNTVSTLSPEQLCNNNTPAMFRKVPQSLLGVSEPEASWFGNKCNEVSDRVID